MDGHAEFLRQLALRFDLPVALGRHTIGQKEDVLVAAPKALEFLQGISREF